MKNAKFCMCLGHMRLDLCDQCPVVPVHGKLTAGQNVAADAQLSGLALSAIAAAMPTPLALPKSPGVQIWQARGQYGLQLMKLLSSIFLLKAASLAALHLNELSRSDVVD